MRKDSLETGCFGIFQRGCGQNLVSGLQQPPFSSLGWPVIHSQKHGSSGIGGFRYRPVNSRYSEVIDPIIHSLPLPTEPIPNASYRLKVDRLARIRFEITTQADDEVVQGSGFGIDGVAPYGLEQFTARDGLTLLLEEDR